MATKPKLFYQNGWWFICLLDGRIRFAINVFPKWKPGKPKSLKDNGNG